MSVDEYDEVDTAAWQLDLISKGTYIIGVPEFGSRCEGLCGDSFPKQGVFRRIGGSLLHESSSTAANGQYKTILFVQIRGCKCVRCKVQPVSSPPFSRSLHDPSDRGAGPDLPEENELHLEAHNDQSFITAGK